MTTVTKKCEVPFKADIWPNLGGARMIGRLLGRSWAIFGVSWSDPEAFWVNDLPKGFYKGGTGVNGTDGLCTCAWPSVLKVVPVASGVC